MVTLDEIKFPIRSKDIWYSNASRMTSIWRIFAMDDKGELDIYEDEVHFKGEKYKLTINNIKNFNITKQYPSYGSYFISWLISFIFIYYAFQIVISSIEYFLTFFTIILFLYPVSLFLSGSDWIRVDYSDNGKRKKAYFTDGSLPGGSVLRGKNGSKKSASLLAKFQALGLTDDE